MIPALKILMFAMTIALVVFSGAVIVGLYYGLSMEIEEWRKDRNNGHPFMPFVFASFILILIFQVIYLSAKITMTLGTYFK